MTMQGMVSRPLMDQFGVQIPHQTNILIKILLKSYQISENRQTPRTNFSKQIKLPQGRLLFRTITNYHPLIFLSSLSRGK